MKIRDNIVKVAAALQAHFFKKKKKREGGTLYDLLHELLMCRTTRFQHFTLLQ